MTTPSGTLNEAQFDYLARQIHRLLRNEPHAWGLPDRVFLGENVYVLNTVFNTSSGQIVVGDGTMFGHNVCLITGTHDITKKGRARHEAYPLNGRDILIGKGVWIASGVTILGPCTIGDDAVIAAGSVVTGGNLLGGYIYGGVPAKAIKPIEFDDDTPLP